MPRELISAGRRDKLVQIEANTPGVAASSMPVDDWDALGDPVYMSRYDLAGDERFAASQDSAWGRVQWQMPYRADMDPETIDVPRLRRLNFNGRIFNIEVASLMDRRIGIDLVTLVKTD